MLRLNVSGAMLLLLLTFGTLRAQTNGVENIVPGTSSDSILEILHGEYTTIDTVGVENDPGVERVIRLAPVSLAGLDGLLI